jgi:ABC-type transport system substrate-binding protein
MRVRYLALLTGLVLAASACTGGSGSAERTARQGELARGGTLRVVTSVPLFYDHQGDYAAEPWSLYRCCLLRTLLSYNGRPTDKGGAEIRPDLATDLPDVSPNRLEWTFHLKRGIHYAPPLQDVEVISADFVRGLEREARTFHEGPGYGGYYSVIRGFDDYADGKATSISGLETPDPSTLRVHLTEPTGDFGYRMAMPAAAPIPPNPARPNEPLGAATGHDANQVGDRILGKSSDRGYLRYLVASGPYMFAGSPHLDFALPPQRQQPVSGYTPAAFDPNTGKILRRGSITLVRNPSWSRRYDRLRPAYPDRIELTIGFPGSWPGSPGEGAASIEAGDADVLLGDTPPTTLVERLKASGNRDRIRSNPLDFVFYDNFNLAQPPFDDIHVRKAASWAIDKAEVVRQTERATNLVRSPETASVATHIGLDSLENNNLLNFDPYRTTGDRGSLVRARGEMRRSKYDRNHDGMCDADACRHVYTLANRGDVAEGAVGEMVKDLRGIGIHLRVKWLECCTQGQPFWGTLGDPANRVAFAIGANWGKDYPNASDFFPLLFGGDSIGSANVTLLGADPSQLKRWGYRVRDVPNVDDRIRQCVPLLGQAQTDCWAKLDKYLMLDVVPWVPYLNLVNVDLVSRRVAGFSWDQFSAQPALDRIALKPGSS